uniref:Uncharacterized protein n=1 Tax=Avena sativa TaxID=4498 RepID=A0ACD5TX91_AVESA
MDLAFRKAADKGDIISLQELFAVKPSIIYSTTRVENNTALHIAASKGHTLFVHHFLLHVGMNMELMVRQNINGDTPLHLAVRAGHLEVVEHLIQYSVWAREIDDNLQEPTIMANKEGNTPMHDALFYRQLDIALKILEVNPRCVHALNEEMQSPLYVAAREGLLYVLKKIADQVSTASVSTIVTAPTALHQAVLHDNITALEILLNNIVELVELTDSSGKNVLHYATQHNRDHMVSMLLNKNSTLIYRKNIEEHTPLHMAAKYGSVEAARALLKQCPDAIDMVDLDGRNVLHIAIINNKVSMLELLLKYELSEDILNKQDNDGNTPLHHVAKLHQGPSIPWLLNDPRIKSFVINKDGHTAWTYQIPIELMAHALRNAIEKGDMPSLLNFLADRPERIYSVTSIVGYTALHLAASKGNDWFVHHVLLYTNRNVGFIISKDINGDTPLHLAVREGHLEVVQHLICYVAWAREIEPNLKLKEPLVMKNKKGNTLLHEAAIHGRYQVAVSLLGYAKEIARTTSGKSIKEYHEYTDDVVSIDDALLVITNADGDTPLHLAAKVGNSLFVDMLIRRVKEMNLELTTQYAEGAITMANKLGNTPLHNAVLHRKSDTALKLLEANPRCGHMLNAAMQSPFYIAVRDGLTYVVKKIADQGLYVASMSTHGTVLHQSVLGDNIRALEILLNRYEELVELTDLSGNNALHYAAQHNNARMVSIFLNKNSSLAYRQNDEKHTPLHTAAYYGSAEAAKELLKQFPDAIEMVDNMGRNALHIAATRDKVNVLQMLLKYVLPEGIVNQQDRDGNTPLHHAAKLFQRQSALLLLNDRRVNPCLVNQDGDNPFALSCRSQTSEMALFEMNLWEELKKHDSRRCKQQHIRPLWQRIPCREMVETMSRDILVATLMSMATFAVTFTVPGGYNQQSGTAIVGHHGAFKILVIYNTISMCGSTAVVLCYIWFWRDGKVKLSILMWANVLIILSGLTMIMSMLTAVYLTVAPASQSVAYVVVAIGASTPFLAWLILGNSLTRMSMFSFWINLNPRAQGERGETAPVSTCCQDKAPMCAHCQGNS